MEQQEKNILNIKETLKRAKEQNIPLSEYTLRRAIKCGSLPCRIIGGKYLIAWSNVERWLLCEDSQDNAPMPLTRPSDVPTGVIRPIIVR